MVHAAEARTWSSAKGSFKIEATFVRLETNAKGERVVVLEKRDGKRIPVVLKKLSKADRKYVESLQEGDADGGDAATKSDADSSEEQGPAKRLKRRGLSRDGDVWVLQEEVQLDESHKEAQGYLDALKEAETAIDEPRRIQATKAKQKLALSKRKLENRRKAYEDLLVFELRMREAGYQQKYNAMRQTFADVFSVDADAAKAKESLIETLRQMDKRIASAEIKYQALRQDPKVLAVLTELGGSLGPRASFVKLKTEFNALADSYVSSSQLLSRGADVMDCGLSPTSVGLPSAQDDAEAFLTAIGVKVRREICSLVCETQMIGDVKEAAKTVVQQAKLKKMVSKSYRAKVAAARREFDRAMAKVDAEKPPPTPNGAVDLAKVFPWAHKKLALMAKAEKIEGPERRLQQASDEIDRLKEEQRLLLERAQEKAKRIRAHCELLSQNASVKTALEKVSGTLQPSANFEQHLRKAKSLQKKLAGKR